MINTYIFIDRAKIIHGDKYDYTLSVYVKAKSKVKIICPIHGIFEQTPNNHVLGGYGCNQCSYLSSTKDFIKKATKIHGNKYNYSQVDYKNNKTHIKIICHKHGEFMQEPRNHLSGYGCSICKESAGELRISSILEKLHIKFIRQKSFSNCIRQKKLLFDFYLPEYNICIEYDGRQHFEEIELFGGKEYLKLLQESDKIKNTYCKNNKIKLLRISHFQYDNVEKLISEFITK
jgi:very-short-patch-repair endonuclease